MGNFLFLKQQQLLSISYFLIIVLTIWYHYYLNQVKPDEYYFSIKHEDFYCNYYMNFFNKVKVIVVALVNSWWLNIDLFYLFFHSSRSRRNFFTFRCSPQDWNNVIKVVDLESDFNKKQSKFLKLTLLLRIQWVQ